MARNKSQQFSFLVLLVAVFFSSLFVVQTTTKATLDSPFPLTQCCGVEHLTPGSTNEKTAWFEGKQMQIPEVSQARANNPAPQVLGENSQERWIEIDLSEQKLKAWEGDSLYLETAISSGLPGTPTPKGEFQIWVKLKSAKMSGGVEGTRGYYYLPNVPHIMYFYNEDNPKAKGYGLHAAYWHNDFGNPRSHGCVNLPLPIAEQLYYWASPTVPEGKNMVYATADNPGTRLVIHE